MPCHVARPRGRLGEPPDGMRVVLLSQLAASLPTSAHAVALRSSRPMATRAMELSKHAAGLSRVAGVDEAGRGPLVGPVVAAAVVC